ncbi:calmodulin, partial [Schistosoma bovis]
KKNNYLSILERDFDLLDRNKNGWLNKKEVQNCLTSFGFDPRYTQWFYVCFYSSDAEMRSAFRSADKNKSGKLDAYELRDFLKKQKNVVSMDLCTKWIRQNDKNGDQKLDYEEFLKFVQSML